MPLPIISPLSVCLALTWAPGPAQPLSITKVYGEGTYSLPQGNGSTLQRITNSQADLITHRDITSCSKASWLLLTDPEQ